MKLLEELIKVQGTSGDEKEIRDFIISYVEDNSSNWKSKPELHYGEEFQDGLILSFGHPKTAIFAHTDTIGFTVGYSNNLIKVGGPRIIDGTHLVGRDKHGDIETELMVVDHEDNSMEIKCVSERIFERGTTLSFKPNFRETEEFIQSPYLDNRLGVWVALKVAETLENGAIVFSTYEEHGGNSVGYLGKFLQQKYGTRQALISDITWVTDGVKHGLGVAISLRDKGIPRRQYINRIKEIAAGSGIKSQLEVESAGGSDGTMLQNSDLSYDWCFIGAPEDNVHTPDEKVHKDDIQSMIDLYEVLMREL